MVKDLRLAASALGKEVLVEDGKDILADGFQFALNFTMVLLDVLQMGGVIGTALFLLLEGRDDAPAGTTGPNNVFEGDREHVALINTKFLGVLGHLLDELHHV